MSINAITIKKLMRLELQINDSSFKELDDFLKFKGFKFNKEIGKRECVYTDENGINHMLYWHKRATFNQTVISTFEGDIFPYAKDMREIIYPAVLEDFYIIDGHQKDVNNVIKMLFNHKFEIIALTMRNANSQIMLFKRKDNLAYVSYHKIDKFKMVINAVNNVSRSLLSAFQVM
jgi:hypothetical protein